MEEAKKASDTEHAADQYGVAVCGVQQFLVLYEVCLRTIRDTHRWNTEEALVKNSGKPPFTCPGNNRGFYHFLTHRNSSKQVGIVKEKGRIRGYFFRSDVVKFQYKIQKKRKNDIFLTF